MWSFGASIVVSWPVSGLRPVEGGYRLSLKDGFEITGAPNIDIRHNTEIAGALGESHLESLILRDIRTGATEQVPASALFVLIGAVPHTDWLPGGVQRDDRGFVLTGGDMPRAEVPDAGARIHPPLLLETSLPGIFAAGDVRYWSIKRVVSAVGEGSIVAAQVSRYLLDPDNP